MTKPPDDPAGHVRPEPPRPWSAETFKQECVALIPWLLAVSANRLRRLGLRDPHPREVVQVALVQVLGRFEELRHGSPSAPARGVRQHLRYVARDAAFSEVRRARRRSTVEQVQGGFEAMEIEDDTDPTLPEALDAEARRLLLWNAEYAAVARDRALGLLIRALLKDPVAAQRDKAGLADATWYRARARLRTLLLFQLFPAVSAGFRGAAHLNPDLPAVLDAWACAYLDLEDVLRRTRLTRERVGEAVRVLLHAVKRRD